MPNTQMHLMLMMMNTPITHVAQSWADPADGQLAGLSDFGFWKDVAKTLERGFFDGIFFADTPAANDQYKGGPETSIRYGITWPTQDPFALIAVMASVTERLGFGVTLSTNGNPPYLAVRRLSTLDAMSRGRIGWNIVTGHMQAEHLAVGGSLVDHDLRYEMADEYMEVCNALWASIQPGGLPMDAATGIFGDPDKVRIVNHEGRFFKCRAVAPTLPSPQGRPVIFQAGSSGRGLEFAMKHAEAVFSIQPTVAGMKKQLDNYRVAREQHGRQDDVRVLFGVQVILGSSDEEAHRTVATLADRVPLDAGLSRLSGPLGLDLSKFDPDQPLTGVETQASRGMLAALSGETDGNPLTLRQMAQRMGVSSGLHQVIGGPETVADRLQEIWETTGCFGFNISPGIMPGTVTDFVDHVVPILQKRGVFRSGYPGTTFRDTLLS